MNRLYLIRGNCYQFDDTVSIGNRPLPHQTLMLMLRTVIQKMTFFFLHLFLLVAFVCCVRSEKLKALFDLHVRDLSEAMRREM